MTATGPTGPEGFPHLRDYQSEPARAILASVAQRQGLTFTVMMARQAGKNELSAQLELLLLLLNATHTGAQGVKASPTYKPQTINSIRRLRQRMEQAGLQAAAKSEHGYIVGLGRARWLFFSAQPGANVVGATASILLEGDEAQDLDPEKWNRDFRPMGATTNATAVLYGTAWSSDTLLEQQRDANRESTKRDGIQRNFEYPWQVVAEALPDYGRYVEAEIARLGATHPLIRTQYELQTLSQGGRLLSENQLALMAGDHPALSSPGPGVTGAHVAGLDLAGQDETPEDTTSAAPRSTRDSTALVIGYLTSPSPFSLSQAPQVLRLCYARSWRGTPHAQLLPEIEAQLRLWNVRLVAGDATGIGSGIIAVLSDRLGSRVLPLVYTRRTKSDLGYLLLARVNAGRILLPLAGNEPTWTELRRQLAALRATYYPGGAIGWAVPETEGHDDLAHAAALATHAAAQHRDRTARARAT